ncbi:MAG: signal peptide peptidase SppA [Ignavibacteriales bacterium]
MRNRKRLIAAAIIGAAILPIAIVAFRVGSSKDSGGAGRLSAGDVIGLIYIEGGIAGGRSPSGLTGTSRGSDYILEQIRDAGDDPRVKAVVIRLNTPGGTAAASQEIAREIARLRRSGKKVVASMGDVCASGGYWVAASADLIIANPATMTGSIGVIMEVAQIEQLMNKIGVEIEVIKSGPLKDIGSSTRKLGEEERSLLQEMVDDIHAQFVEQVAQGRGIEPGRVRDIADGRVFTGRQAKDLGLVDDFGNLEDAINAAARLAGLREGWSIRDYGRQTLFERFRDLIEGGISLDGILGIPAGLPVGPGRLATVNLVRFK